MDMSPAHSASSVKFVCNRTALPGKIYSFVFGNGAPKKGMIVDQLRRPKAKPLYNYDCGILSEALPSVRRALTNMSIGLRVKEI